MVYIQSVQAKRDSFKTTSILNCNSIFGFYKYAACNMAGLGA